MLNMGIEEFISSLLALLVLLAVIVIYLSVRLIKLSDDVRFIADVFREEHPQTKYRSTPIWPVVVLLLTIFCLILYILFLLFGEWYMSGFGTL